MTKIGKWLGVTLVGSTLAVGGCGAGPEAEPSPPPDACAGIQEAVDELAAEFDAIDPATSERIANQNWWADQMGFARKDDPATVVVERYAYLVLESGDCFDAQTRADAQRLVDDLRGS